MEFYLLLVLILFSVLNLILLFFNGIFLVRFRDQIKQMMAEFVNLVSDFNFSPPPPQQQNEQKTWDQKYEEEMDSYLRRVRADSGLADLPYPKVEPVNPVDN